MNARLKKTKDDGLVKKVQTQHQLPTAPGIFSTSALCFRHEKTETSKIARVIM